MVIYSNKCKTFLLNLVPAHTYIPPFGGFFFPFFCLQLFDSYTYAYYPAPMSHFCLDGPRTDLPCIYICSFRDASLSACSLEVRVFSDHFILFLIHIYHEYHLWFWVLRKWNHAAKCIKCINHISIMPMNTLLTFSVSVTSGTPYTLSQSYPENKTLSY